MANESTGKHRLSSYAVNVAHLLTTLSLAAGLLAYAINQHERLTRVEERGIVMEARLDREVNRTAQDLALIRASQQRMEDRFDRFMQRVESQ